MKNQRIMKLLRDVVKRDFGAKVTSFVTRISMQIEAAESVNDMNILWEERVFTKYLISTLFTT